MCQLFFNKTKHVKYKLDYIRYSFTCFISFVDASFLSSCMLVTITAKANDSSNGVSISIMISLVG
uniref:Uncharacterized protein n=1 Tax=Rhizophora mucronata TaxID=61149 RepID=A0A2P2JA11_RHIMU